MNAGDLTKLYVDELQARGVNPPEQIKARVGREAKRLLGEGKAPEGALELAIIRLAHRGLQPTALPGLVIEAQLEMLKGRSTSRCRSGVRCEKCGAIYPSLRRLEEHDLDVHSEHDPERMQEALPELEKTKQQVFGGEKA